MSLTNHQKDTIISTQAETIKDLQSQLDLFRKHMILIERIAEVEPIDNEILTVATEALEIDKAHNSM